MPLFTALLLSRRRHIGIVKLLFLVHGIGTLELLHDFLIKEPPAVIILFLGIDAFVVLIYPRRGLLLLLLSIDLEVVSLLRGY